MCQWLKCKIKPLLQTHTINTCLHNSISDFPLSLWVAFLRSASVWMVNRRPGCCRESKRISRFLEFVCKNKRHKSTRKVFHAHPLNKHTSIHIVSFEVSTSQFVVLSRNCSHPFTRNKKQDCYIMNKTTKITRITKNSPCNLSSGTQFQAK